MEGWKKLQNSKTLLNLAIFSSIVTTLMGILYHWETDGILLKILLIIENTIKAFTFRPTISLEAAQNFIDADPVWYKVIIGYFYMLVVFIAPYCTFSAAYKIIDRFLRVRRQLGKDNKKESIIIFGNNKDVDTLVKSMTSGKKAEEYKDYRISLVTEKKLGDEERYRLLKSKVAFYEFDILKSDTKELKDILGEKHLDAAGASYIFLMDDNSMKNFSLLQTLTGEYDGIKPVGNSTKIFCRCEDDGVLRLIESYYDTPAVSKDGSRKLKHKDFDLEILDVFDLQIWDMFLKEDPSSYYTKAGDIKAPDPDDWKLHMLILGFGKLGQQAAVQAMNLGVASSRNDILIDVVDYDVDNKKGLFMSRFRQHAFIPEGDSYVANSEWADGHLELRFFNMNVRYGEFAQLLEKLSEDSPFTYIVSAIDDTESGIFCLTEVQKFLQSRGSEAVERTPVMLRIDSDQRLRRFIESNSSFFGLKKLRLIEGVSDLMKIERIIDSESNDIAKEVNFLYDGMGYEYGPGNETDQEAAWNKLTLFKRDANRASAYHLFGKEAVLKARCGDSYIEELKPLFTEGGLYPYENGSWKYGDITDAEFMEKAKCSPVAFEMLKMEHRRWCYYTMSCGWAKGRPADNKDKEMRHVNVCLSDWEELERDNIEYCKYDLMPLMAIYEKRIQKN